MTRLVLLAVLVGATVWTFRESAVHNPSSGSATTWNGQTMGTQWTVKLIDPVADRAVVERGVQDTLDRINDAMSTWTPDSELSRFNAANTDAPFEVSPATIEVVRIALEVARQSDGAFDPTIGPLIETWGFNTADTGAWRRPTPAAIADAQRRVDYRNVAVEGPTLIKQSASVELDLSAVAKGYAVDEVARWLDAQGYARYMVEVGGEVRVRGEALEGRPWRIGLERPDPEGVAVHGVVTLTDASLATSGTYRNFYASEGQRLSHLVDPRSGAPVAHRTVSVSVRAPDCAHADAWATALLVLGSDEGASLAERLGIAALFVDESDSGLARKATSTFGPFDVVD